jgi:predicted CXXCH cytochrome family protein
MGKPNKEKKMKKTLLVSLALGLALAAGNAYAGSLPATGIVGSAHDLGELDMTVSTAFTSTQRICVFCHTPHFSAKPDATLTYTPLWNKTLTTISFNYYDNGADPSSGEHHLNADDYGMPLSATQASHTTLLCLSCHDGSVALNAYGEQAEMDNQSIATSSRLATVTDKSLAGNTIQQSAYSASGGHGIGVTGDLTNHHPVDFDYVAVANVDLEIALPSATMVSAGGVGGATGLKIAHLLSGNNMTCATCHDVHNTQSEGDNFIWVDNTGSAFCLACHLIGEVNLGNATARKLSGPTRR